jgi:uncharacterized protein
MDTPFAFGKQVTENYFTDREEDRALIRSHLSNRVNTILISPRRWGKSSLMRQLGMDMMRDDPSVRFIHIDLYSIRSEEDFFRVYANTVLKVMATRWEELLADIKAVAHRLSPFISVTMGMDHDFRIGIDLQATREFPEEILELPERLAERRGLRPIICLDEFQNISAFSDMLGFQKLLRSVWQTHSHTTYCIYGSKRSMMTEMFTKRAKPFYRFGEVHFLRKIKEEDWIPFIVGRFASTGRTINDSQAREIVQLMECHPYYVQQHCHHLWVKTPEGGMVDEGSVGDALEEMIRANTMMYQREAEDLSAQQIGVLLAVANAEPHLTSATTIARYRLRSSAYVVRTIAALESRDLIDTLDGRPEFVDPVFRIWLKRIFENNEES